MEKSNAVKDNELKEILESLSPNERRIIHFLKEGEMEKLVEKTNMNKAAVLRSLEFLSNKNLIKINTEKKKMVELGLNGLLYKQKGLPERRLINLLSENKSIKLEEAKTKSQLNDDEFKAALGALKNKALISLINGNIIFSGQKQELIKKTLEEQLIDSLPIELEKLEPEQKFAVEKLKNRRGIVEINNKNKVTFEITEIGKKIASEKMDVKDELIESLTPEILKSEVWKSKKFRRYDIKSSVPKIYGGKRHFVNQATDYARKVWTEMGFKEMSGNSTQIGFWNFDALFTAQDHPVREIQDTFYIKDMKGKLPDKKIVEKVKEAHEKGVSGSRGWGGKWNEKEAERIILRTHTTCLSAQTLAMLSKFKDLKDKRGKFFAVGKCFRNETVDWGHLFEFNQTEGIVVDKDANFRNLLGYLKEFAKKMGYEKVKFQPSYFPYTEPSVEGYVWNEEKKQWIEVLAAGIFRPEVVVPLLGEYVPVLAWGPGFDRMIMSYYGITDLREMYSNNITKLRETKFWSK